MTEQILGGAGTVLQATPDAPTTEPETRTALESYQRSVITPLETAERMLAAIETPTDALRTIAFADAARAWARSSGLGTQAINHATILKIKAEKRLADTVDAGQATGEIATQQTARLAGSPPDVGGDRPTTLGEIGVSWQRLDEARKLRTLTPDYLQAAARKSELDGRPISRAAFLRELAIPERNERRRSLVRDANPRLPTGPYQLFYVDPPWRYEHVETENRAIENQYPTMSLEEICAEPVASSATPDAILFLWATNPKLAEAMQVIEAWDFTYRTNMVWTKDKIGMGYYVREKHELLLIARRGEFPPPPTDACPPSVVEAPRGEHSAKPDAFYDVIESMYPDASRVELFARKRRPGWYSWGNQL